MQRTLRVATPEICVGVKNIPHLESVMFGSSGAKADLVGGFVSWLCAVLFIIRRGAVHGLQRTKCIHHPATLLFSFFSF